MSLSKLKISIGIASANDEKTIENLMKSLAKLYHIRDPYCEVLEIIIVSSGCYDKTETIIRSYQYQYPNFIKLLIERKRTGKANAINRILQKYEGDALILIPADAYTTKKELFLLAKQLLCNPQSGVISGHPIIEKKSIHTTMIYRMLFVLWTLHNLTLLRMFSKNKNTHATGELMIIRRGVINRIPSDIINDDAYIALVASERHWKVSYEPNAYVMIKIPMFLRDYITQRRRVILGHKQLQKIKKRQTTTYKQVSRTNIYTGLSILSNIHSIISFFYLIILSVIELYLEVSLIFPIFQKQSPHIWKRINTEMLS